MTTACQRTPAFIRLIAVLFWSACIVILSLDPHPPTTEIEFIGFDKFLHFFAYTLLTILVGWYCSALFRLSRKSWLIISASIMVFGGAIEICQKFLTSTRNAELGDFLANSIGALLVMFAAAANLRNNR